MRINENTEVVFSNQYEVDEHTTQDSMTCDQDCIFINLSTEINNNNKNQNYLKNWNIINNNVTSEVNICTYDYNINNNNIITNN